MRKVVLIYRTIPQYRMEFYNLLRDGLKKRDINLELIYGNNAFLKRNDQIEFDWATFKKNISLRFHKFYIIWQPCVREVKDADLVIVEQANKLLFNYYLIFRRIFFRKKFAFWGHGLNLQIARNSFFNKFKLTYINRANWWFAYTNGIRKFLVQNGVNPNQITVVQNAIDTRSMNEQYHDIRTEEVMQLQEKYGLQQHDNVLIYCGALSKEKNMPFLFEATDQLIAKGYQFKLLIIGSGPMLKYVEHAILTRPWIRYAGTQFGRNKATHFKLASMFLLPGAVGLAILDSFAFETPMVTIEYPFHGPEIEYAVHGVNAIIAKNNVSDYVSNVANLLDHPGLLEQLKQATSSMIAKYNIENMVDNFIMGVEKALG